jgi:hypothetical protein
MRLAINLLALQHLIEQLVLVIQKLTHEISEFVFKLDVPGYDSGRSFGTPLQSIGSLVEGS